MSLLVKVVTLFLCPLGFANGQPIYYFSHIQKHIQLVSDTNRLEEKQNIIKINSFSFGFPHWKLYNIYVNNKK